MQAYTVTNTEGMTNQQLQNELEKAHARIRELEKNSLSKSSDDNKFRHVIDASPVPYALNDDQQNIVYLNPAFINTFGYDLQDIPALDDWWPRAYPDAEYRQWVADTWQQHLDKARRENSAFNPMELRIRCKNNDIKTVIAGASSLTGAFAGIHLVTLYDITESLQAEKKLNQTVTLLENVINSTPDLIFVKNEKLQTILCNKAYARAVGKEREEMYGYTDIENGWDSELVKGNPEKNIRGFMQDDMEALSGVDVYNPSDPANVDGEVRIFDTHKLPLRNANGEIEGVVGIARDVTEKKQAEARLLQSEARFRQLFENIEKIAVQGYDQNRRVIFWNAASEGLYGYTEEQAVGQKIEDLIIPQEMQGQVIDAIQQWVDNDIAIPSSELQLKRKDGQPVSVYSSHAMLRTEDGGSELYCLDIDISELKETQQELQKVNADLTATLRTIPDLLFELDENGRYINIWSRDEELLVAQKELLLGHNVAEKLSAEEAKLVMLSLKQAAETGYSQGQVISLPLPDGIRWFELSTALKPGNEDPRHFFILSRDITERKHTEEQLQRSQKMDALGQLTGGIAHDFNNMLGVILGYAELLEVKLTHDPQLSRYIDQINTAGNRAKTLTSKLLSFARKQPNEKRSCDINAVLQQNQHMLEKTLTARIDLLMEYEKDLWPVCIEEEMLVDAVLNMCINSMHAIEENGRLTIKTKNCELTDDASLSIPAGDYVQLDLTDTGSGIDPKFKDKIFEPFFTTKGTDGTGLGMSQVYGFVKQSAGDIQLISEEGKGTQIIICIPRYIKQENDGCCVIKDRVDPESSKHEQILVVDDEPALLELVKEILIMHNYRVECAESAEQALEILNEKDISLMLTDVIMPGMNGYQLAAQVAEKYPQVKILLASGYNETSLKNIDTFQQLDKPYHSNNLLKTIRNMLDS